MSILNYFGQVLEEKYPDLDTAVLIKQRGNTVSMTVETPQGEQEKIEKTLDEYGLVVTRQMAPEEFLDDKIAILELRAGTHLIVQATAEPIAPGTLAPFDLMVDDVEAMHATLEGAGLNPSELDVGRIHTSFTVAEPNGYLIKYNSSHNTGLPV